MFGAAALIGILAGAPGAARSGPVTGTVVATGGGHPRPVPGETVTDGAHTAVTDAAGRFTFADVPPRYDLTIVNPARSVVTIYEGLTRRDPILAHAGNVPAAGGHHHAVIQGKLIGGGPYRSMHVRFFSPFASRAVIIGRFGGGGPAGPDFGPLAIDWDGPSPLEGEMLALQLGNDQQAPGGGSAWFACAPISLHDQEVLDVDLKLGARAQARLAKVVIAMAGDSPISPGHSYYRSPDGTMLFRGPSVGLPRDSFAPDLGPGLELCIEAFIGNPYLRSHHVRCGPPPGKEIALDLRAAPDFSTPAPSTPAAVGLKLGWSAVPRSVYLVTIKGSKVSGDSPRIQLVTADTGAVWPDLHALGVAFPKAPDAYQATISAKGPFSSVDDAAGPNGIGNGAPREYWSAESQDLGLPVLPPAAPETAACQAQRGLVCGPTEVYQLSAMNKRIRYYPDFAAAIHLLCVRTCDDARAFTKAYADYAAVHPGFDAHMPVEPEGPPPPLPPSLRRKPTPR